MATEIKAPHYPESVEDGTLVTWYKAEGDAVSRDDKLADIETDKVVLEVAAPDDGVLSKILKKEGETVLDGEVMAVLDQGNGAASPSVEKEEAAPAPEPAPEAAPEPVPEPAVAAPVASPAPVAEATSPALSPAVRKLLAEHNLEAAAIAGTGKGGRVTKEDVRNHLAQQPTTASAPAEAKPGPAPAVMTTLPVTSTAGGNRPEERAPMSRLRKRIAERLVEAQQTAAILTTFNEVNMQPVMQLRSRLKDRFQDEHGVKLGFMSFFTKACIEALRKFPVLNASVEGTDIIYHGFFDIGVAVSTDRGLVVPILRNADQLTFAEIEASIQDVGRRGQEGKLSLDELAGGTFTITNGGVFGSMLSTPILNPPQSGILGMHKIEQRPAVENGEVVVRPMMYLALSYDHRIVDGREAVLFLVTIKEILEDPARLLLQV